jgi:CubicO group peptidase (beta-lactamase class C family)
MVIVGSQLESKTSRQMRTVEPERLSMREEYGVRSVMAAKDWPMPSGWSRAPSLAVVLFAVACGAVPLPPEGPSAEQRREQDRAARVVAALAPVVRVKGASDDTHSIDDRMRRFHVPGVSIAVVDGDKLVWARGFGVADRATAAPVTPSTLFQAASISKPVTATATMRLAELGKLSLDEDVTKYLRSWKLPETDLTASEKVTLRRLLSHTAGINARGFRGYESTDALPTVQQILRGDKPANNAPIRITSVPGSELGYSGGGSMIEQLVLMDTTDKPFPQLMRELVLIPAGMRDSTFEQPLPPPAAAQASSAHDVTGAPLRGRFMIHPELAAAGLWSTPTDLLAWAMAINDARSGKPLSVLSPASAAAMLTPQSGPVALGPIVRGEGRTMRFGHSGWADGFHAEVVYFPELGKGAAVMVNGAAGRPMLREILYAVAREYGWPELTPVTIEPVEPDSATREAVVGFYGATVEGNPIEVRVRRDGEKLFLESTKLGLRSELVFVSKATFVALDSGDEFALRLGTEGAVEAIDWGGVVLPRLRS